MNNVIFDQKRNQSTSSGVSMRKSTDYLLPLYPYSTSGNLNDLIYWLFNSSNQQTTVVPDTALLFYESSESPPSINELKKLSGLTWEQIAKIFNVSRRSIHFWASGKKLSPFNTECLNRFVMTLRYIDRGSADVNRSLLLESHQGSDIPLNLLKDGKFNEVKRILGKGNSVIRGKTKQLSVEATESRRPPSPKDLVSTLDDSIQLDVPRSRPAITSRSKKSGIK
jgi:hypothetical protein